MSWIPNSIVSILFCVVLVGCSTNEKSEATSLPYYTTPDLTPLWLDGSLKMHRIQPFEFTDQNGALVTDSTTSGKVYVTNFFFTTCPGVCRLMTGELMAVQEAFSSDDSVLILSHTVMPWVDTVAQLKRFEELKSINGDQWKLLTGSKEDIYAIARDSYFADEGSKSVTGSDEFLHTENVMLIDQGRRIRGVYNGTSRLDITRLIEDIHLLR